MSGGMAEMQRGEESQQSGGSCSVMAVLSQDTVPMQGGFPSAVAEGGVALIETAG